MSNSPPQRGAGPASSTSAAPSLDASLLVMPGQVRHHPPAVPGEPGPGQRSWSPRQPDPALPARRLGLTSRPRGHLQSVLVPAIVLEIALRASRPCGDGEAFGDQDVNGVAEQASQPSGSHGCRTRVAACHLAITWRCLHPVQLNAGIDPADVYPPLTGQEIHGALRRPAHLLSAGTLPPRKLHCGRVAAEMRQPTRSQIPGCIKGRVYRCARAAAASRCLVTNAKTARRIELAEK